MLSSHESSTVDSSTFLSLYKAVCPAATFAQFLSHLCLLGSSLQDKLIGALPPSISNTEDDTVAKPVSSPFGLKKSPLFPFNVASASHPVPPNAPLWPGSQVASHWEAKTFTKTSCFPPVQPLVMTPLRAPRKETVSLLIFMWTRACLAETRCDWSGL